MSERPKSRPDASCENCARSAPYVVKPGIGAQSAEHFRLCTDMDICVSVTFYCPRWKRALLVSRI